VQASIEDPRPSVDEAVAKKEFGVKRAAMAKRTGATKKASHRIEPSDPAADGVIESEPNRGRLFVRPDGRDDDVTAHGQVEFGL
jgi:hypothetical protein